MMKILNRFLWLFLIFPLVSLSQNKDYIPKKYTQKGFATIDFLSIEMPDQNEANMGFAGIHYNLDFDNFYTGLGFYGAVSGIRGGFFTLGVNAGYKAFLSDKLFIDTGFHFGGGGGAAAPDGGGAFILPHFNLGYQFKKIAVIVGYSYVDFFDNGEIQSNQFRIAVQVPLNFEYTDIENAERSFNSADLKSTSWNKDSKKVSYMIHLNNLNVGRDSQDTDGNSLSDSTIRLAGFELNYYANKNWFFLIKTDGAYAGIPAGYMNILLGGGYHFSLNKNRTNILGKFAVGAGGGGGVDTQGGVLLYPDISIEQHLFNNMYLSLNTGFLLSPNSHFISSTYGLGIKYYSQLNGIKTNNKFLTRGKFKGFEAIIKQDIYSNARRITDPTQNLYQISFQLNYHLNKTFYIAGQTSFANFGGAGAYAEGLAGFGLQSSMLFKNRFNVFLQVLSGGAGGGNISTGEGLIVKPSAGINYKLSNNLALRSSLGYVKAKGGALSSPSFNFGLSYQLAFLNSK